MTTTISCNEKNLLFTRYLYVKLEVKHSLLIAILNKKAEEALFWLYELYYSGFQDEIPEYLEKIFDEFFSLMNPRYTKLIKRLVHIEEGADILFGSIVISLCILPYQVNGFVESYFNVKCKQPITPPSNKRPLFIRLNPSDIEQYQTCPAMDPPRLYLKEACKYTIHKETNSLFDLPNFDFRDIYRDMDKWIYYACLSPVWEKRVIDATGIIDHNKKTVTFENDDAHDDFWDMWNLETDEQLVSVTEKSTGTNKEPQWTITQFCKKYGAEQITRKLKLNPLVTALSNTLVPS